MFYLVCHVDPRMFIVAFRNTVIIRLSKDLELLTFCDQAGNP